MKLKEPKPKENPTLSEFMMQEAEATFRMFRDDYQKVKNAMEIRSKKMEEIKAEQTTDLQRRLKIEGALSACQHLVTRYKGAWEKERDQKRAKRSRTK